MRSHAKTHKKPLDLNQRTFSVAGSFVVLEPKCCLVLTPEDQVIEEEILQALHCTHQNYSFASVSSDNQRFRLMFCGLGNRKELPAVRNQNKIFNSVCHTYNKSSFTMLKTNLLLLNSMKLPAIEMYQSNTMYIYITGPKITIKL